MGDEQRHAIVVSVPPVLVVEILRSSQDGLHDVTGYIGEAKIAALASEDELAVIDPEEMENGGVEVVNVGWV